ncbi:hypothetical protein C8J57DRAFT_1287209, partial [Mycena rebaudengoi]
MPIKYIRNPCLQPHANNPIGAADVRLPMPAQLHQLVNVDHGAQVQAMRREGCDELLRLPEPARHQHTKGLEVRERCEGRCEVDPWRWVVLSSKSKLNTGLGGQDATHQVVIPHIHTRGQLREVRCCLCEHAQLGRCVRHAVHWADAECLECAARAQRVEQLRLFVVVISVPHPAVQQHREPLQARSGVRQLREPAAQEPRALERRERGKEVHGEAQLRGAEGEVRVWAGKRECL